MKLMTILLAIGALAAGPVAAEYPTNTYEVKVTNITNGISFTPILAATHAPGLVFFRTGLPASDALADLAEGGDTGPLEMWLLDQPERVLDTTTTAGLLGPGQTATFMITGDKQNDRLSLAAMLLPTNDAFVAVSSMKLPFHRAGRFAMAYDAGSEVNDELCASIPGPTCGGAPFSEGQAEGFVYVSSGIHGHGDLQPADYDWHNPIARVSVVRVD